MDETIELYQSAMSLLNDGCLEEAATKFEAAFSRIEKSDSLDRESRLKLIATVLVDIYIRIERYDLAKPYEELSGVAVPGYRPSSIREEPETW